MATMRSASRSSTCASAESRAESGGHRRGRVTHGVTRVGAERECVHVSMSQNCAKVRGHTRYASYVYELYSSERWKRDKRSNRRGYGRYFTAHLNSSSTRSATRRGARGRGCRVASRELPRIMPRMWHVGQTDRQIIIIVTNTTKQLTGRDHQSRPLQARGCIRTRRMLSVSRP